MTAFSLMNKKRGRNFFDAWCGVLAPNAPSNVGINMCVCGDLNWA